MKRFLIGLTAALTLALPVMAAATPDPEGDGHKVTICHRTASDTNPYVFIEVDEASLSPGHLDNADPGHKPTFWKSDGVFRGVAHVDGDPKDDYLAQSASDCEDFPSTTSTVPPSTTTSSTTTPPTTTTSTPTTEPPSTTSTSTPPTSTTTITETTSTVTSPPGTTTTTSPGSSTTSTATPPSSSTPPSSPPSVSPAGTSERGTALTGPSEDVVFLAAASLLALFIGLVFWLVGRRDT